MSDASRWDRTPIPSVTSRLIAALSIATVLLHVVPARGTTGGPRLIEVLGWDPVDRKVFVAQHYRGESGYPPAIAYFDFAGKSPGRPVVVRWSVSLDGDPASYGRRASALRGRLRALPRIPAASSFWITKVLATDSVDIQGIEMTRYHVRVSRLDTDWGGALEVQTYRDSSVRVLSIHPIPGRKERLAIVSFIGIPYEGGYEAQLPIMLETSSETSRIEWDPFRR